MNINEFHSQQFLPLAFLHSPAWRYSSVNETKFDGSEDESDPAFSNLESKDDDED